MSHHLTDEELEIVARVASRYPRGVPTDVWGYGPMAESPVKPPCDYYRSVLEEFG